MYDWSDLRLASIMSFFTAASHTSYCIFPSPKFHQLEEVKIQVLHSVSQFCEQANYFVEPENHDETVW